METKGDKEKKSFVDASILYTPQLVHSKVQIPFADIGSYSTQGNNHDKIIENYFKDYARKHLVNKCHKEGYISSSPFKIVSYSAGKSIHTNVIYDVVFEFKVCYPHEGMIIQCIIQSITKIGIKAVVDNDEYENPIVVFASHLHNKNIFQNSDDDGGGADKGFKEGQIIQVKVLGFRFEINDPSIYVLAEIKN
jgi:DNA-directed RNA polymerase subunit E'/Rpb7